MLLTNWDYNNYIIQCTQKTPKLLGWRTKFSHPETYEYRSKTIFEQE
jgi:hypothetical protein